MSDALAREDPDERDRAGRRRRDHLSPGARRMIEVPTASRLREKPEKRRSRRLRTIRTRGSPRSRRGFSFARKRPPRTADGMPAAALLSFSVPVRNSRATRLHPRLRPPRPSLAAPLPSRRSEIVEVVEKVAPAVVNIAAEQTVRRAARSSTTSSSASTRPARGASRSARASIIDPKGIILTNDHVISGASKIIATTKCGHGARVRGRRLRRRQRPRGPARQEARRGPPDDQARHLRRTS